MNPEQSPLNCHAEAIRRAIDAGGVLIVAVVLDEQGQPMLLANSAGLPVCLRQIAEGLTQLRPMVQRMAERIERGEVKDALDQGKSVLIDEATFGWRGVG
ncbi:MAG: hypothetical protein IPM64_17915 [Phycisphaerales bacterium]|nr:hypothetical protein [Phycisphaerales bacterium]